MRLTVQVKKEQLIASLVDVRRQILEAASALPVEKRSQAYLGEWDIFALLAHLAGWDHTNLQAIEQIQASQVPGFYQYIGRDWREYNAYLVATYRLEDLDALVDSVRSAQQELLARVVELPPVELYRDRDIRFRGYKITVARLLEAELKDERVHLAQLEAFAAG